MFPYIFGFSSRPRRNPLASVLPAASCVYFLTFAEWQTWTVTRHGSSVRSKVTTTAVRLPAQRLQVSSESGALPKLRRVVSQN